MPVEFLKSDLPFSDLTSGFSETEDENMIESNFGSFSAKQNPALPV